MTEGHRLSAGEVSGDPSPGPGTGTEPPTRTTPGAPAVDATVPDAERPALSFDDLDRFRPDWCLFWGKHVRNSQLAIWIPYLRRSRYRYAVMASEDRIRDHDRELIASLPNVMFVEPFSEAVVWFKTIPGFRGFLYIGTQLENFVTVNRVGRRVHIYIGHGESGKATSGYRTGSLYDSIFVAHYSAVGRFPRVIRRWVWSGACAIGTVLVEGVRKDPWTRPRPVRTILYAPTWESYSVRGDFTSLDVVGPLLTEAMPALAERGIRVILRPHPATGLRRPELRDIRDALYAAGAESGVGKTEAFERADVLISDVSGVTAEFLFTEKPAIIPVTPRLLERHPDAGWLDGEYPWVYRWQMADGDGASPAIESLLGLLRTIEASDPRRDRRAKAARYMFRGHRSLEDAVRTFDLALATAGTRRWRIYGVPLRIPFEAKRLLGRTRRRFSFGRSGRSG